MEWLPRLSYDVGAGQVFLGQRSVGFEGELNGFAQIGSSFLQA